jgi:hypothetical protein
VYDILNPWMPQWSAAASAESGTREDFKMVNVTAWSTIGGTDA